MVNGFPTVEIVFTNGHTNGLSFCRPSGCQAQKSLRGKLFYWEPARPSQGLSDPAGPKCRKSLENVSRCLRPGDLKNLHKVAGTVWEVSGESPESVWRVFLVPETFWRFFGSPGRRLRDTFSRLFQHFGPGGPRDACMGRASSQLFDLQLELFCLQAVDALLRHTVSKETEL